MYKYIIEYSTVYVRLPVQPVRVIKETFTGEDSLTLSALVCCQYLEKRGMQGRIHETVRLEGWEESENENM